MLGLQCLSMSKKGKEEVKKEGRRYRPQDPVSFSDIHTVDIEVFGSLPFIYRNDPSYQIAHKACY